MESEGAPPRWSSIDKRTLAVLAVVVLGSLPFLVHPWYDAVADGSVYVVTARALAAGEGYSYLGELFHARPPGFSCLLAPLMAWFGTDFAVLNLFVSLCGAACVVLLFLQSRVALGGVLAALVALAIWLNPGFQRLCNQPMSDVPGVALLLGCLLADRWARRQPSWCRESVLGLVIGLSSYVRAFNLLLVPAILASRFGDPAARVSLAFAAKRCVPIVLFAGLTLLPWSLYQRGRIAPPPAEQNYVYDYTTGMLHEDPGDPSSRRLRLAEILGRSGVRIQQIASVLGSRMQVHAAANQAPRDERFALHAWLAAGFVALLVAAAIRAGRPADFFCLAALLVIAVYFGFRTRLLLPVLVLGLPGVVGVVRDGLARWGPALRANSIVAAALAAMIVVDFHPRQAWEAIEKRHRLLTQQCRAISAALDGDARVGTLRDQGTYSVYLDRPVAGFGTALYRDRRPATIERIIDKYGLNTVFLAESGRVERPAANRMSMIEGHFRAHYGPGRAAGEARIWRVRP